MLCPECGAKLNEDSTFCDCCGKKIEANPQVSQNEKASENATVASGSATPIPKKKGGATKVKIRKVSVVGVLLVVAITAVTVIGVVLGNGDKYEPVTEYQYEDVSTSATEQNTANVIILCGQSNAYGASPLTAEVRATVSNTDFSNIKIKYNNINSDDGINNWRVHYSNNSFETFRLGIGGQADAWFGPELGVAYHLATTAETKDETWYIIKYTAAGTYLGGNWIYDTSGKYNNADNSQNIYDGIGTYLADGMLSYVDTALNEIASIHGANNINIRAFMWHQGESDSCFKDWANQYGKLQNCLVNTVRTEFESRDVDGSIGFVDGGIAAYDSTTYYNALTGENQSRNMWIYSDKINTHKTKNASLWYVPADTSKNVINKNTAGLYNNKKLSFNKLDDSIWVDTSTCVSKLVNNNENGEYDGAHYCGDSMLKIGIWYAQGMLQVSDY